MFWSRLNFLNRTASRPPHKPIHRVARANKSVRLIVEALEDRTLLSTLTVTTGTDSVPGSLRAQIAAAHNGDTIVFKSTVTSVTLTSEIEINKNITINGTGFGGVTINSSGSSQRVFEIDASKKVTMTGLDIKGGNGKGNGVNNEGGGILNHGTLVLTNDIVECNSVTGAAATSPSTLGGDGEGGGIYNDSKASLLLTHDLIQNNTATGGAAHMETEGHRTGGVGGDGQGGGIYNNGGVINITSTTTSTYTTIKNNHANGVTGGKGVVGFGSQGSDGEGGGMYICGGTVTINGAIFGGTGDGDGNTASGGTGGTGGVGVGTGGAGLGGGAYLNGGGTFTAQNISFIKNTATGGAGGNPTGQSSGADGGSGGVGQGGGMWVGIGTVILTSGGSFTGNLAQGGDGTAGANYGGEPGDNNGGAGGNGGNGSGGAVFVNNSTGDFTITDGGTFTGNTAKGGKGAAGGSGSDTGLGGDGGNGGFGQGGAICDEMGTIEIDKLTTGASFTQNKAIGGAGSNAGNGGSAGGDGGTGGAGGSAQGGAIASGQGSVTVDGANFGGTSVNDANTTQGGNGGDGGMPGSSAAGGDGGAAGDGQGGAIFLDRTFAVFTNDHIYDNSATGGTGGTTAGGNSAPSSAGAGGLGQGGGIFATNTQLEEFCTTDSGGLDLTVSNSTITGNHATGGVGANGPSPFLDGGAGGEGQGGGYWQDGGTASITDTTFDSNQATGGVGGNGANGANTGANGGDGGRGKGGGIYAANTAGTLDITAVTLSNNKATGGKGGAGGFGDKQGGTGGDGANGKGGGIFVDCPAVIQVSMINDTLAANQAIGGDGGNGGAARNIANGGTANNQGGNGGNAGDGKGGGLYADGGDISLLNCTVAGSSPDSTDNPTAGNCASGGKGGTGGIAANPDNSGGTGDNGTGIGGGLYQTSTANISLKNTIVAHNHAAYDNDVHGTFTAMDHNIILDPTGGSGFGGSDLTGPSADPHLSTLANYGGPTKTMIPLGTSNSDNPAIDGGDNTGAPTIDQRSQTRPYNSIVDIGAVEFQGIAGENALGNLIPTVITGLPVTTAKNPLGRANAGNYHADLPLTLQVEDSLGNHLPGLTVTISAPTAANKPGLRAPLNGTGVTPHSSFTTTIGTSSVTLHPNGVNGAYTVTFTVGSLVQNLYLKNL